MRVLIAEQAQHLATGRAAQLLIDGHEPVTALTTGAVRLKLTELPDALLLGNLGSSAETIALLRDLRGGAIHRADNTLPVVVVGADTDADRIRYNSRWVRAQRSPEDAA